MVILKLVVAFIGPQFCVLCWCARPSVLVYGLTEYFWLFQSTVAINC